jgi:hypothetical protein
MAPSFIPGNQDGRKAAREGRPREKFLMRRLGFLRSGPVHLSFQEKLYRIKEECAAICGRAHTGAESLSTPSGFASAKERVFDRPEFDAPSGLLPVS